MFIRLKKTIILLGDLAALHLALWLTIVVRYPRPQWNERYGEHWPYFLAVFFIWLLVFYINDLYNLNLRPGKRRFLAISANSFVASALLSTLYFYLNSQSSIAPKTNLAIFVLAFALLFIVWRGLCRLLGWPQRFRSNLAIIGSGPKSDALLKTIQENPGAGYQASLLVKTQEELTRLKDSLRNKGIRTIVVADDLGRGQEVLGHLFDCLSRQTSVFSYPDFYELMSGKVPVEAIDQNWFLENLKEGRKRQYHFFKRFFDLSLAFIILIFSLPFWPLVALAIKLDSRGPVFFRQTRLGREEKPFGLIKFRSMRTSGNDFSPTEENDARITRVGSFLRKSRLDELPQIINVIKGEMSFIGPRPERPEIAAELEKLVPFYKTRLLVKPGLTGWDQISGKYHSPSPSDSLEKLQYDLYYLKQRSLYLDLAISLRTLAIMFSQSGR